MSQDKKYRDEEWLQERYIDDDLSYEEIADLTSVKPRTIRKYVRDFNLGIHECSKCDRKFKNKRDLKFHKTSVHKNKSANNKYMEDREYQDSDWLQGKLEQGYTVQEIADECGVTYDAIRRYIREDNLGIHCCEVESCEERYPTKEGLMQHQSRDHPEIEENSYGLKTEKVESSKMDSLKERIENEEGLFNPEERDKNLKKAREKWDAEEHSKRIQKVWEERDPEDYHQRRDGWWEKYAESRDNWGPNWRTVDKTGHKVASGWEEEVDLMLHESDMEYEYEGETFSIEDTWNTPDFVSDDWILEVKSPAGYRDKERLDMVGEYLRDEVDREYIILGKDVDMPCNKFVEWEDRRDIISILTDISSVDVSSTRSVFDY